MVKKAKGKLPTIPQGAVKEQMPNMILPMKARLVDAAFDDEDWIFEIKWDGYRALANIKSAKAILYSRNGLSFERYETVFNALQGFAYDVIFDGEVVAFDENGIPSFCLIQNYQRLNDVNLRYYIFDIIYFEGYDLKHVPLIERKALLKNILKGIKGPIRYSDHVQGQGIATFKFVADKGMEGIIAKKADSIYQLDKRSDHWLKIKTSKRQEVIICGYNPPKGSREYMGSLVLGIYENKKLTYCGNCGTGFNSKSLKAVYQELEPLTTTKSPFIEKIPGKSLVNWVKPQIVCEISFSEWTENGTMRHPVFQGLRQDKKSRDVVRENESPVKEIEGIS
jgi:bifunctional non-homologous end joining protein LigD